MADKAFRMMMQDFPSLFGRYYGSNNLTAADRLCRIALSKPESANLGLFGLSLIARRIGQFKFESMYVGKLANPYSEISRPLTGPNEIAALSTANINHGRFLVVNGRRCGFWSDFSSVIGCYILAYATGRVPITNWRQQCIYNDDPQNDAFINFFEPLSDIDISALPISDEDFYPRGWNLDALKSHPLVEMRWAEIIDSLTVKDKVLVCANYISPFSVLDWVIPSIVPDSAEREFVLAHLFKRLARPVPSIRNRIDTFIRDTFCGKPYIAAHIRGTDKFLEQQDLDGQNNRIFDRLEQCSSEQKIFLLTDDNEWLSRARSRFGQRLVYSPATRNSGFQGPHHDNKDVSRHELGVEIILDTFVAAGAETFVGLGQSNVSAVASLLRRADKKASFLIGNNQLLEDRSWGLVQW